MTILQELAVAEGRFLGDPVLGNVTAGIATFTNPQAIATYMTLVVVQYVFNILIWVPLHFLFWDESTATPQDQLTLASVRDSLGNLGDAVFFIIVFFLLLPVSIIVFTIPRIILANNPTLLTRRKREATKHDFEARLFQTITQANFLLAFRTLISPAGLGKLWIFNTLLSTSYMVALAVAPLMSPNAWSFLGRRRRKRRDDDDYAVEDYSVVRGAKLVHQMIEAAEIKYSG